MIWGLAKGVIVLQVHVLNAGTQPDIFIPGCSTLNLLCRKHIHQSSFAFFLLSTRLHLLVCFQFSHVQSKCRVRFFFIFYSLVLIDCTIIFCFFSFPQVFDICFIKKKKNINCSRNNNCHHLKLFYMFVG